MILTSFYIHFFFNQNTFYHHFVLILIIDFKYIVMDYCFITREVSMKKEWLIKTIAISFILLFLDISTSTMAGCLPIEKHSLTIDSIKDLNTVTTKTEPRGINVSLDGVRGENGWFVKEPLYLIIIPDNGTQIESVFIKFDGLPWVELQWMCGEPTPIPKIVEDGLYQFDVKIYDSELNVWFFSFEYKVDIVPPTIELKKEKMFFNKLKFIADVSDGASGVWRVEFYLDDELMFTDYNSSFEWIWEVPDDHSHVVKAIVYDMAGNNASNSISVPKSHCIQQSTGSQQVNLLFQNLIFYYQMRYL